MAAGAPGVFGRTLERPEGAGCVRGAGRFVVTRKRQLGALIAGVGLFLDQRANRARVAECVAAAPSGRWLNLFAHTGAFSVALLAAGAGAIVLLIWHRRRTVRRAADFEARVRALGATRLVERLGGHGKPAGA